MPLHFNNSLYLVIILFPLATCESLFLHLILHFLFPFLYWLPLWFCSFFPLRYASFPLDVTSHLPTFPHLYTTLCSCLHFPPAHTLSYRNLGLSFSQFYFNCSFSASSFSICSPTSSNDIFPDHIIIFFSQYDQFHLPVFLWFRHDST